LESALEGALAIKSPLGQNKVFGKKLSKYLQGKANILKAESPRLPWGCLELFGILGMLGPH